MVQSHTAASNPDTLGGNRFKQTRLWVDLECRETMVRFAKGDYERNPLSVEWKIVADVNIAGANRNHLQTVTGEIIDLKTALLVRPDDRTQGWIGRMKPNCWIVGGIARLRNGFCLY
jgi:hypothetical protein